MGRSGNVVQLAYLCANKCPNCREPDLVRKMEEYFKSCSPLGCTRAMQPLTFHTNSRSLQSPATPAFAPTFRSVLTPCSSMHNTSSPHGKCQAKGIPRAQVLPQGTRPLTGYVPYTMRHRLVFSLKGASKGKRDSASSVPATAEAPCKDSYQMALHVLRFLFTRESWHYSPLGKS